MMEQNCAYDSVVLSEQINEYLCENKDQEDHDVNP